ncbi:hypothetical protein JF535_13185 [Microbulbifer salipaludis]|uniref:Bacteriophage tail tape measure N-terminal domain-containing protein n=1 Tax=Microbulbifer salipaludis TaxID=187980 RepID=A0ABS3E936_9GAMM|nr:hypothetical protein [Microbulbifer salipaludis]MBN8431805.1 hypothetical protein [Microbulbifer salipaludis]
MATAASLLVELGANTAKFHQKMGRAQKENRRTGESLKKMAKTGAVAFAAMAAAAATGIGAIVAHSLRVNDQLAKTADKLGLTTEALAGLRHAAELTGVSQQKLDLGLQRMTRRVAEAAQGTGEARGALQELGLSAQQLARLSPDQQFNKIATAMNQVGSQSDRVRLGFKLFDSEGVDLINTLKLGESGLAAVSKEAEILGLSISRVDAAKMEQANDAMTRAGGVVKGLGNEITAKVSPIISGVAKGFTDWAVNVGGFEGAVNAAFNGAVKGAAFVLDAFHPVELVFRVLRLGALSLGSAVADAMAASADSVARFMTDFLTPFRVTFIGLIQFINSGLQKLNQIGLVSDEAAARAGAFADAFSGKLNDALSFNSGEIKQFAKDMAVAVESEAKAIESLVEGPSRGERLQAWVAEAQATATQVAQATTAAALAGTAAIEGELIKRTELETWKYEQELLALQTSLGNSYLTRDLFYQIEADRKRLHEQKLTDLEKAQIKQRIANAQAEAKSRQQLQSKMWTDLMSLTASKSRKLFEIGKAAAIANAVVSTYESANKAMTTLPWPLNLAAAAATVAAGIVNVQRIRSQSFQGGGGGGTSVGSASSASASSVTSSPAAVAPTPAPSAAEQPAAQTNIIIQGNVSGNDAGRLVDEIRDLVNNGDVVLIDPNSRNGQELAALNA